MLTQVSWMGSHSGMCVSHYPEHGGQCVCYLLVLSCTVFLFAGILLNTFLEEARLVCGKFHSTDFLFLLKVIQRHSSARRPCDKCYRQNTEHWSLFDHLVMFVSSSSKADAQHSLHFYKCMCFNLWITHFSWTLCVCIGVALSVCEDWEGVGGEIAPAFCCWSTLRDGLMLQCTKNTLASVCLCVCHVFMYSNVCVLLVCSCLFLSTVLVSFNLGWDWPLKKAK